LLGGAGLVPQASAQRPGRIVRIGLLSPDAAKAVRFAETFRERLRELGHAEGQDVVYEIRYAGGRYERLAELAAELVRLDVDVIVAHATPAIHAAKQATTTIPIVMAAGADAVGTGVASSFPRTGGNITGLTIVPEFPGQRFEVMKEVLPKAVRLAVLWNPDNLATAFLRRVAQSAAHGLGLETRNLQARAAADLDTVFSSIAKARADGLVVFEDAVFAESGARLAGLARQHRLPALYGNREIVEAGGLMSYGTDLRQHFRRSADFVDRILKGAPTADLPVEEVTQSELVINLGAARALGVTLPGSLLARADTLVK
jgi:putative ABC transport system substrate-binding protein